MTPMSPLDPHGIDMSKPTVRRIVIEDLQIRKVGVKLVLKVLIAEPKENKEY